MLAINITIYYIRKAALGYGLLTQAEGIMLMIAFSLIIILAVVQAVYILGS